MLFAFGHTVVFKTPHNVFFRRLHRVATLAIGDDAYFLTFLDGGTAWIPKAGTVIRLGRHIKPGPA